MMFKRIEIRFSVQRIYLEFVMMMMKIHFDCVLSCDDNFLGGKSRATNLIDFWSVFCVSA